MFGMLLLPSSFGQSYGTGECVDPRDGKIYKTVKIGGRWWMAENLNYATETGSWVLSDDPNGTQYGRFYDWKTAKTISPAGWHLPSKQEFQDLLDSIGGNDEELYHHLLTGGKSGFNVLLTGSHREEYGRRGKHASLWSSTLWWFSSMLGISENPWRLTFGTHKGKFYAQIGHGAESECGFNVRCVKND